MMSELQSTNLSNWITLFLYSGGRWAEALKIIPVRNYACMHAQCGVIIGTVYYVYKTSMNILTFNIAFNPFGT